jgi:hypothetical protein
MAIMGENTKILHSISGSGTTGIGILGKFIRWFITEGEK